MISFEKSVGGVIFRRQNGIIQYLLLHYQSGHWDFPRGHIEEGESDIETFKREAKEETGISDLRVVPSFKKQIKYFYRAKGEELKERKSDKRGATVIKKVVYYVAETKTNKVKLSFEHIGYDWLPYEKALERITYKNSKDVLKEANKYLEGNI